MIKHSFSLALKAIYDLKLKPMDTLKALKSLDEDMNNVDFLEIPIDFVAPYIHHLFLPGHAAIRNLLMKFICEIELSQPETIIEQYQFDKLIALSIDQRPNEQMQTKVDEEKNGAFRCVGILLKYRKYLPNSMLRALVSIYNVPGHPYKPLIVAYLLEAALVGCPVDNIPEISNIYIEAFHTIPNPTISELIKYSVEHKFPFVYASHFASSLISPIAQITTTDQATIQTTSTAITNVLKSWAPMLAFGFQGDILHDLIECLPHQTEAVVSIFRDILNISETPNINDGFTGLVLYYLTSLGLVEKLNILASTQSCAASFLSELLPFVSQSETRHIDLSLSNAHDQKYTEVEAPMHGFKRAQGAESSDNVTSINNFSIAQDASKWDYRNINKMLTVILPHNELEANSSPAKAFYNQLLTTFADNILSGQQLPPNRALFMIEAMNSLFNLFMKFRSLLPIVEKHDGIKRVFMLTIENFGKPEAVEPSSQYAAFFGILAKMMANPFGTQSVRKMDLVPRLGALGTNAISLSNIKLALSKLQLVEGSQSIDVFRSFLLNPVSGAHQIAIDILREKRKSTINFANAVFKGILLPHIKFQPPPETLNATLNFICELMDTSKECLEIASADEQVIPILQKNSRFIYVLLFRSEQNLQRLDLKAEALFWTERLDRKYLNVFDAAAEANYTGILPTDFPCVTCHTGTKCVKTPPHLFGEVVKTKKGAEAVRAYIPELLSRLENKSSRERRAAMLALGHAASSEHSDALVEEFDIGERLFQAAGASGSSVLMGTLIAALSMFQRTPYLAALLARHSWQIFLFGEHSCVIPVDARFLGSARVAELETGRVDPIEGADEITHLLRQLTSQISLGRAKEAIKVIYRDRPADILQQRFARYGMDLMATFSMSPEARLFVEVLFKAVPLLPVPDCDVDAKEFSSITARVLQADGTTPLGELKTPEVPLATAEMMGILPAGDVFLNDADFKAKFGMAKDAFYALPPKEAMALRMSFLPK